MIRSPGRVFLLEAQKLIFHPAAAPPVEEGHPLPITAAEFLSLRAAWIALYEDALGQKIRSETWWSFHLLFSAFSYRCLPEPPQHDFGKIKRRAQPRQFIFRCRTKTPCQPNVAGVNSKPAQLMSEPKANTAESTAKDAPLIFVVDDEPMLLELAGVVLEPLGYNIKTFRDPKSALRAFTAADPPPALLIITPCIS
jgi:CheY-like chemotaxis protein